MKSPEAIMAVLFTWYHSILKIYFFQKNVVQQVHLDIFVDLCKSYIGE